MAQEPHEPTELLRRQVEAMSSYGIPQEDIANVIGVDAKTMRKYYRYELDTATAKANAMVGGKLYKNCMDGKESSIFFWLKTRGGYSEVIKNENRFVDKEGEDLHAKDKAILKELGIDIK